MKYWLSHLPLEVWVDCYRYPLISREKLGQIVARFNNRKYTEYLQFYLHDWGKRKLEQLWIDQNGLYKIVNSEPCHLNMDFPRAPMPGNIKSFKRIAISHFDAQTRNFLREITPILTNVNLELWGISPTELENFCIVLAHLLPLLNRINSLLFNVRALATMQQCIGNDGLAILKKLTICHFQEAMDGETRQTTVYFLTDWLTSPQQDGNEPKWCKTYIYEDTEFGPQISMAIREQFLAATHPSTFALILSRYPQWEFAEFHLSNGIGKELHGIRIAKGHCQILRHRTNCGKELQEWIEKNQPKMLQREIYISAPTIGLIDGMDAPVDEDEDLQPSTSKKARIF